MNQFYIVNHVCVFEMLSIEFGVHSSWLSGVKACVLWLPYGDLVCYRMFVEVLQTKCGHI